MEKNLEKNLYYSKTRNIFAVPKQENEKHCDIITLFRKTNFHITFFDSYA